MHMPKRPSRGRVVFFAAQKSPPLNPLTTTPADATGKIKEASRRDAPPLSIMEKGGAAMPRERDNAERTAQTIADAIRQAEKGKGGYVKVTVTVKINVPPKSKEPKK